MGDALRVPMVRGRRDRGRPDLGMGSAVVDPVRRVNLSRNAGARVPLETRNSLLRPVTMTLLLTQM